MEYITPDIYRYLITNVTNLVGDPHAVKFIIQELTGTPTILTGITAGNAQINPDTYQSYCNPELKSVGIKKMVSPEYVDILHFTGSSRSEIAAEQVKKLGYNYKQGTNKDRGNVYRLDRTNEKKIETKIICNKCNNEYDRGGYKPIKLDEITYLKYNGINIMALYDLVVELINSTTCHFPKREGLVGWCKDLISPTCILGPKEENWKNIGYLVEYYDQTNLIETKKASLELRTNPITKKYWGDYLKLRITE